MRFNANRVINDKGFKGQIKKNPKLENMLINRKGNRLSITSVTAMEWKVILDLGKK